MSNKLLTDSFKPKKRIQHAPPPYKTKDEVVSKPGLCNKFDGDMKLLREFDLNLHYGPCIGITRLERWNRANKHDLEPDKRIRDLIQQHNDEKDYTECLWTDYTI